MAGTASQGPANTPLLCRNIGDWTRQFGARESTTPSYDSIETMFREGATNIYFSRAVGPNPVTAFLVLNDQAGVAVPTLRVEAIGPGNYGLTISVQVQNGVGANTFNILTYLNGVLTETSPDLASPTDAVNWATGSSLIRITDLASGTAAPNNNPAVLAITALGGAATDDRANIVDAQKTTALQAFGAGLGPGILVYPGATTASMHGILRAQARAVQNREAFCDLPDSGVEATLDAVVVGVNDEYSATFGPWVQVPGVIVGTTRIVPPVAFVAGVVARNDSRDVSPNSPSAGPLGRAQYAIGVTQAYDDATRERLNGKGVNIIRMVDGLVTLYGYRTNADPILNQKWIGLANQRLRLAITDEVMTLGEEYEFGEIDGRGHFFAEVAGAVTGVLKRWYDRGSLYGATPDDAYFVDTGPAVNTPDTIANNELHVVISAKMSQFAEYTVFEIVKLGLTEPI